jgi:hypothetical protein
VHRSSSVILLTFLSHTRSAYFRAFSPFFIGLPS